MTQGIKQAFREHSQSNMTASCSRSLRSKQKRLSLRPHKGKVEVHSVLGPLKDDDDNSGFVVKVYFSK